MNPVLTRVLGEITDIAGYAITCSIVPERTVSID